MLEVNTLSKSIGRARVINQASFTIEENQVAALLGPNGAGKTTDEPTSGVATSDKFKVMDTIIGAIRKQRTATLIIEHDMDIVSNYAQKVMVLAEGDILAQGEPEAGMQDQRVRETLFGVSD